MKREKITRMITATDKVIEGHIINWFPQLDSTLSIKLTSDQYYGHAGQVIKVRWSFIQVIEK